MVSAWSTTRSRVGTRPSFVMVSSPKRRATSPSDVRAFLVLKLHVARHVQNALFGVLAISMMINAGERDVLDSLRNNTASKRFPRGVQHFLRSRVQVQHMFATEELTIPVIRGSSYRSTCTISEHHNHELVPKAQQNGKKTIE